MKKLVFSLMVLLMVGFGARISEGGGDNPSIAALDPQTFVVVDQTTIHLLKIERGKLILQDSVLVYTRTDRDIEPPSQNDTSVLKRLNLGKK